MRPIFILLFGFFSCMAISDVEAPIEAGLQCADELDNDGDGLFDCEEASCSEEDFCLPAIASCGDGVVEGDEDCDDANDDETDDCLASCRAARCGDGFVQVDAEECDDANQSNNDVCTNECQQAVCGDGFVNAGIEECDDANLLNGDGCNEQCLGQ